VSLAVGVLTLLFPGATALALVLFVAAWSLVTGVAEVVAAIRLRQHIQGEWLLGLSGILSIAFGILLFISPMIGAIAIAIWIGAYAWCLERYWSARPAPSLLGNAPAGDPNPGRPVPRPA